MDDNKNYINGFDGEAEKETDSNIINNINDNTDGNSNYENNHESQNQSFEQPQAESNNTYEDDAVKENDANGKPVFYDNGEYRYIPNRGSEQTEIFKAPVATTEEANNKKTFYNESIKSENTKKKKGLSFKRLIAACLICSIAGGGSIGAGFAITKNALSAKEETTGTVKSQLVNTNYVQLSSSTTSEDSNRQVKVIKEVFPSIVNIFTHVKGTANYSTFFNGTYSVPYEGEGAGSGIIFYEDEEKIYVATNAHVIEGAVEITITIEDVEDIPAKVIGSDSRADLAVLSVLKSDLSSAGINDIRIAVFGNSDKLEVGENVIAIGNALGQGKTATGGMISALSKEINVDGKTLEVIQTDSAINSGNSGGALVNLNGEVIGINTAKSLNQSEGMGYAIPSNVVMPIIEKLLTEGTSEKPYLGIQVVDITSEQAQLIGIPMGVLVAGVIEGGAAEQAGIQTNDIIVELAGEKTLNSDRLLEVISKQKVGDTVKVRIIRDGENPIELNVTIMDANAQ